jgi:nicotinate-nucleotide adenylyltransferase
MNVLLYGGSFNPVHYAHLKNIELGMTKLDIDKILVICDKFPHFKENEYVLDYKTRVKLINIALKEYNFTHLIEVSDIMKDDTEKRYTYEIIKQLKDEYPNDNFYFLIGSDQANNLDKWKNIDELKKLVHFVITKRSNDNITLSDSIVIKNEPLPYSSTLTRKEYASTGINGVDKYIRQNGLYLDELLKKYLSEARIRHSQNVAALAKKYASKYKLNSKKAYIAGMLHDITKEMPLDKQYELVKYDYCFELNDNTVHAYSAVRIVRDQLKIEDFEILEAIMYHTTAFFEMKPLSRLIYVCDMLSVERDFNGVGYLRSLLNKDLNLCYCECVLKSLAYLKEKGIEINKDLKKLDRMIRKELRNGK